MTARHRRNSFGSFQFILNSFLTYIVPLSGGSGVRTTPSDGAWHINFVKPPSACILNKIFCLVPNLVPVSLILEGFGLKLAPSSVHPGRCFGVNGGVMWSSFFGFLGIISP